MFTGLATFMPNSPRQLIRGGQAEEARLEYTKIRRDLRPDQVDEEFALMRVQIEFEMQREITSYREIFRLFRHRALVLVICARALWVYADLSTDPLLCKL